MASCKSECGSTRELVELVVDNLINKAIRDKVLQGALVDCDNTALAPGSRVVRCEALVALVKKGIKDGDIPGLKDVTIDGTTLLVTHGDGRIVPTPIPGVVNLDIRDGKIVFTENGQPKELQLPGVTDLVFRDGKLHFKEKGVNASIELPYVYDMRLNSEKNRIDYKVNGVDQSIPLPEIGVKKVIEKDNIVTFVRPDGTQVDVPKSVLKAADFDSTIVKGINEAGRFGISAFTKGPISGVGSRANPITLKYNPKQFSVVNGELTAITDKPVHVENLDTGLARCGFSTFIGVVDNTGTTKKFVVGMPVDASNERANESASAKTINDLVGQQAYDFAGYQLASDYQVDQFFIHANTTWRRTNDGGVDADCRVRDPKQWSAWRKETNLNIPLNIIETHTREIASLLRRVVELEKQGKCVNMTNKNLNVPSDGLNTLGFKCFWADVEPKGNKFTIGIPKNMDPDLEKRPMLQDPAMVPTDLTGTNVYNGQAPQYRVNGYQIATEVQVDQFITEAWGVWRRSNDHGMLPDGSLRSPTGWTRWRLLDNANEWQQQINELEQKHEQCCTSHAREIDAIKKRLDVLKSENDRLKKENSDLSTQLRQSQQNSSSLQNQLRQCNDRARQLQEELDRCRKQPRPNPPPTPQPPTPQPPTPSGSREFWVGNVGGAIYAWPNIDGYALSQVRLGAPYHVEVTMRNAGGTISRTGYISSDNDSWYSQRGSTDLGPSIGTLPVSGGAVTMTVKVNGVEMELSDNTVDAHTGTHRVVMYGPKTIIGG